MFIGCSSYPACNHIESLDQPKEQPEEQPLVGCPDCGKGHLVERKSRYGKTFYACDNYPKCKFCSKTSRPLSVVVKRVSSRCYSRRKQLMG